MSVRLNSDGGLPYLEAKLGVFTHGPSRIRRNAALDILTGRVADHRFVAVPGVVNPEGPATLLTDYANAAPAVLRQSTRLYASPWLAASSAPPVRLRLVRSLPPPPARRWLVPSWVLVVGAAGVLLVAGFELRTFTDRAPAVQPSTVLVETQAAIPDAILVDAPVAEVAPIAIADEPAVTPVAWTDVSPPPPVISAPVPEPASVTVPASVPAAVPASVPVPASEFGLLLDEGFTSNARHWPNDPLGTAWLAGGAYQLVDRQATQFVAVGIPGTENLGDSVVTGSFRKVGGPDGGGYGLILRDQEPQTRDGQNQFGHYYVFEAGDRGQVGLWLRDGDHWVDLLTWTASDAVRRGKASNELTVSAIGDHLSFLVNGVPVASQTDTVWHSGAVGVFVGGDGNQVALDHVAVRVAR